MSSPDEYVNLYLAASLVLMLIMAAGVWILRLEQIRRDRNVYELLLWNLRVQYALHRDRFNGPGEYTV